jgi:hypothetical protein
MVYKVADPLRPWHVFRLGLRLSASLLSRDKHILRRSFRGSVGGSVFRYVDEGLDSREKNGEIMARKYIHELIDWPSL